jgi:hypothetical protein
MHAQFFSSENMTSLGNTMVLHNIAMSNYTGIADMPSDCGELCQVNAQRQTSAAILE